MGTPLRLYFAVTERAVSAVLAQDQAQAQKPIYFVSKVLQGLEVRYQALEKAALFSQFYNTGDDRLAHPEGSEEARCSWEDGEMGGGAVGVRYQV